MERKYYCNTTKRIQKQYSLKEKKKSYLKLYSTTEVIYTRSFMLADDDLCPVQAIHCIYSMAIAFAPPTLYILVEARSFLSPIMHEFRFPYTGKERKGISRYPISKDRMCINCRNI